MCETCIISTLGIPLPYLICSRCPSFDISYVAPVDTSNISVNFCNAFIWVLLIYFKCATCLKLVIASGNSTAALIARSFAVVPGIGITWGKNCTVSVTL